MKRFLVFFAAVLGLALLLAIGIAAEEQTATFYNGTATVTTEQVSNGTLTLPAAPTVGTKKFIGWTLVQGEQRTLYPAGATLGTLPGGDLRFEAFAISLQTLKGAAVSLTSESTLRFDGALDRADYDALLALVGADNFRYGVLIAPYKSVGAKSIELNAPIDGLLVRTASAPLYTNEQYAVFGGRTDVIPDAAILEKYAARAFVSVQLGGTVVTVYGGYNPADHARSVHGISAAAFEDRTSSATTTHQSQTEAGCYSRYSATQLTLLRTRLDKVVCVGSITGTDVENKYSKDNFTFIAYDPNHYASPYVVKEILREATSITYVVVGKDGGDHQNLTAYFLEGSYRAPDRANEWKEDGLYITVSTTTGR